MSLKGKPDRVGDYELHQVLGEGSFGKVKVARHVSTSELFAVKIVGKCSISDIEEAERVYRETAILTTLRHENVIRLCEVIDTSSKVYLVMEFARGGELLEYISKKRVLSERETNRIVHQMVDGIDYCHKKNVIHRDLKLENVLLDESGCIKIADFGLSNSIKFGQKMGTDCGTPSYTSPEQISSRRQVGAATDVWSLGVMVFTMMCGFLPFVGTSTRQIFRKIVAGQYLIPDFISDEGRNFLERLLTVDVDERITIHSIRAHNWFLMEYSELAGSLNDAPSTEQVDDAVAKRDRYDEEQRTLLQQKRTKGSVSVSSTTSGGVGVGGAQPEKGGHKRSKTTSITVSTVEATHTARRSRSPSSANLGFGGPPRAQQARRRRSPSADAIIAPLNVAARKGAPTLSSSGSERTVTFDTRAKGSAGKVDPAPFTRSRTTHNTGAAVPRRTRSPRSSDFSAAPSSSRGFGRKVKQSPSFTARRLYASTPDIHQTGSSLSSSAEKESKDSAKKGKPALPFSRARRGRDGAPLWKGR